MKHLGLFEGIGGFSLAAKWMGWDTVAWCEIDPFCQQLLRLRFPKAKEHADIRATDFSIYRGIIDILTGGSPCQDVSIASRTAKGVDGSKSGLWREQLRAVDEIRPKYAIIENSSVINKRGLATILNAYSDIGYDAEWQRLQGNQFGLAQRRRRAYIILYPTCVGDRLQERQIFTGWDKPQHTAWRDSEDRIYGVANGVPRRVDRHRSLGNSLIPAIPLQIFKAIESYETILK